MVASSIVLEVFLWWSCINLIDSYNVRANFIFLVYPDFVEEDEDLIDEAGRRDRSGGRKRPLDDDVWTPDGTVIWFSILFGSFL